MSHTRHLPVWKAALDLAVHLEHAVRCFPRYQKYTLGAELRQTAQRLCRLEARVNDARDTVRVTALDELVLGVEEMKTLLTLAQEVQAFANFNEGLRCAGGHRTDGQLRQTERGRRRGRPEALSQASSRG
jgi:hypothetical protein